MRKRELDWGAVEKPFGTFHGELVYLTAVSNEQLYMYRFILDKGVKILRRLSLSILFFIW